MITSGSHQPDIDVAAWGLPEGTAMRFERADPALRSMIAAYAVLDSDPTVFNGPNSWLLPSSPMLWLALTPDVKVKARRHPIRELGAAMLIGPSSVTMPVTSHGGVSIVVELTPRGWARLFDVSATSLRDRIVPLAELRDPAWVADLLTRLDDCGDGLAVKGMLDRFFADHLPPASNQEGRIARIEQLLAAEDASGNVLEWPLDSGIGSQRTLARVAEHYFGFPPKLLQRRKRFLGVFTAMLVAPEPVDFGIVPPGYHDVPHFLRDARHFLGMTARQFRAMQMAYLRAALRARTAVIGAPLPLLDPPAR